MAADPSLSRNAGEVAPSRSPLSRQHSPPPPDDGAEDVGAAGSVPASRVSFAGRAHWWLVGGLLLVTAVLLANLLAIHALTVETKRVACYERLAFISSSSPELNNGVPPESAARLCEGPAPLIEYRDDGAEARTP